MYSTDETDIKDAASLILEIMKIDVEIRSIRQRMEQLLKVKKDRFNRLCRFKPIMERIVLEDSYE